MSEYPWIKTAKAGEKPTRVKKFDLAAKRSIDGELTNMTIDYIKEQADKKEPFFAYVPFTAMHFPTQPSDEFAGRSGNGIYADLLVQTDHYVGQISDAIKKAGIEKNTIFILTADNGPEVAANGNGQFTGWTGPWAGTYFTALEGGLRVPFIAKWPDHIPKGTRSNEIVHLVDLFPTLLEAANAEVPNDRLIDGKSMNQFMTGKTDKSPRDGFPVFVGDDLYAVKWRNWKAHFIWQDTKYSPKKVYSTVAKVVNLIQDPREERQAVEPYNAWTQYPGVGVILAYQKSLALQPNVPKGAPDSFSPPALKRGK
jgi:arylsulfatase A-like enzyme